MLLTSVYCLLETIRGCNLQVQVFATIPRASTICILSARQDTGDLAHARERGARRSSLA